MAAVLILHSQLSYCINDRSGAVPDCYIGYYGSGVLFLFYAVATERVTSSSQCLMRRPSTYYTQFYDPTVRGARARRPHLTSFEESFVPTSPTCYSVHRCKCRVAKSWFALALAVGHIIAQ